MASSDGNPASRGVFFVLQAMEKSRRAADG
jgi:hypothetical protein